MTDTDEPVILGPVKQWSYSRLKNFEKCPHMVYLAAVKKEKRPEWDDDHPAMRGIRVHNHLEAYVKGETDEIIKEMKFFQEELDDLREAYTEGKVSVEGDWGFDINWASTGWWDDDVWARIKLDAMKQLDETTARVIDYKTGKKFGNEVSHTGQAQLYMIAGFLKYPDLNMIETDFYYLDQKSGNRLKKTYTRNKLPLYMKKFTERAMKLTTCENFRPKPSKMNCKYCDFGPDNGSGVCPYGATCE